MPAQKIRPALTARQWKTARREGVLPLGNEIQVALVEDRLAAAEGDGLWAEALETPGVRTVVEQDGDAGDTRYAYLPAVLIEDGSTPASIALPRHRHLVAALCLHEQPFGFTQSDVRLLRRTAKSDELSHIFGLPEMLLSLADRIAALLPPPPA